MTSEKKRTPFDWADSAGLTKEYLMLTEADEREYNAWMVNRTFSYHPDTVFYANEANLRWQFGSRPQYDYLFHTIRRRKRFAKWGKRNHDDSLKLVMEYYQLSKPKAEQALRLLSEEQINTIRDELNPGGVENERKRPARGKTPK